MSADPAVIKPFKEPRPAKEQRDELRRDQIVVAAQRCVVRHGFHASSMAQIAASAQMSVGQIYRYFPSKEAIVHAIVERIVDKRLGWIDSGDGKSDVAIRAAARMLSDEAEEQDDKILLLEATAEASRNPAVAAILRAAHARLRAKAVAAVRQYQPSLSEHEATLRVEMMAVLSEGTAFRQVTEPLADQQALHGLYREVIEQLLVDG
ncbi:MAG: TetR/AcrR family transcriptional regulator [Steroidobacteraceae bacterium]